MFHHSHYYRFFFFSACTDEACGKEKTRKGNVVYNDVATKKRSGSGMITRNKARKTKKKTFPTERLGKKKKTDLLVFYSFYYRSRDKRQGGKKEEKTST